MFFVALFFTHASKILKFDQLALGNMRYCEKQGVFRKFGLDLGS